MDEKTKEILYSVFQEVLNVKCHSHGSKSDTSMGMYEEKEGVQWNIDISKKNNICKFGVNLEGLKYNDWPISKLINMELKNFELYDVFKRLNDRSIIIAIIRDAWQVTARPNIRERIIGDQELSTGELTKDQWRSMLLEALQCLDYKKGYPSRSIQIVTLQSGIKRAMEVSPHLYIYKVISDSKLQTRFDIYNEITRCKKELEPIYNTIEEFIK